MPVPDPRPDLAFVDELAAHPEMYSRGIGSFVLEQLQHLARYAALVTTPSQGWASDPVDIDETDQCSEIQKLKSGKGARFEAMGCEQRVMANRIYCLALVIRPSGVLLILLYEHSPERVRLAPCWSRRRSCGPEEAGGTGDRVDGL